MSKINLLVADIVLKFAIVVYIIIACELQGDQWYIYGLRINFLIVAIFIFNTCYKLKSDNENNH